MKRSTRVQIAKETVAIMERGRYELADGRTVDIADEVNACLTATRYFTPEDLDRLRQQALSTPALYEDPTYEVSNETTLQGIARLVRDGHQSVAALNFASAKNPGGGFLNGSQAQEESLARASALYASLLKAPVYYDVHRHHRDGASALYTDAMILSPACPIFRDDEGALLSEPQHAAFITSAAPNAGAIAKDEASAWARLPEVFERRAEYVLALAASQGYENLVLGAWGCGVFRNDPNMVARIFARYLHGVWAGRFSRVLFSVLDTSPDKATFEAFHRAFETK